MDKGQGLLWYYFGLVLNYGNVRLLSQLHDVSTVWLNARPINL
jgi:hypothetical protein